MIRPMNEYRLRIAVYAAAALAGSLAVAACTHDFDAYQATGDVVPSSADGSAESSTNGSDGSTSSTGVPDSATVKDASTDAACATAPMCAATSTTCKAACESTLTTCTAQCGNGGSGNSCKSKCKNDRDNCVQACTDTCHTCAGMGCTAACN
jgi:hypothetical protein